MDYSQNDISAMAAAIYDETRGEPRVGRDAVAYNTLNRSRIAEVAIPDFGGFSNQLGSADRAKNGEDAVDHNSTVLALLGQYLNAAAKCAMLHREPIYRSYRPTIRPSEAH